MAGPTRTVKRELIAALYEAHGPLCWLCKGAMSRELVHPDPKSITFDHLVPLSLKGTWDVWNLRLAHKACNHARGNCIDADEIAQRIVQLLREESEPISEGKLLTHNRPRKTSAGKSADKPAPKLEMPEEKSTWTFWVDGRRIVGRTYFDWTN